MSNVKVLVEGYAKQHRDGSWRATSTCVLIEEGNLRILVDPGQNRQLLLDAFAREQLTLEDIDLVFLTHHHLDHLLNIRLFPQARICFGDHWVEDKKLGVCEGRIPGTSISIIPTPGHTSEHCALLAKTPQGQCVIAGDIIWYSEEAAPSTDRQILIERQDPFAQDIKALKESRIKLLEMADYLIPGHGKSFKLR